eukprot:NODE_377_length_8484_cov_0.957782.p1 type:complete len:1030 gc:universal NODE_377_length_8484_cov_0.957782:4184-7273(+)
MQRICTLLEENKAVNLTNLAKILNKTDGVGQACVLKAYRLHHENLDSAVLETVQWNCTRNLLLMLLPLLNTEQLEWLKCNFESESLTLISNLEKGKNEPYATKLVSCYFDKLSSPHRLRLYQAADDLRIYSYSLKYNQTKEYVNCIIDEIGEINALVVIKSIDIQLLEHLWENTSNERVLNEICKISATGINGWREKKFAISQNTAKALLKNRQNWEGQALIYTQLLEYEVVLKLKNSTPLSKIDSELSKAFQFKPFEITSNCFLTSSCLSLFTNFMEASNNTSHVCGPLAYKWIKSSIFTAILMDEISKLKTFLDIKFDLILTQQLMSDLKVLYQLCKLWIKMKSAGIYSLSKIQIPKISDFDIEKFAQFVSSFYDNTPLLGHAYQSIFNFEINEAMESFDKILASPPSDIVDKIALYESFYVLLPFLYMVKSPKILQSLATGIIKKFEGKKMKIRCAKIQYWINLLSIKRKRLKFDDISEATELPNQLLKFDLIGEESPAESLKFLEHLNIKKFPQIISWLHDDNLELFYRQCKYGSPGRVKINAPLSISLFEYNKIKYNSYADQAKSYFSNLQLHSEWILNSLLIYPSGCCGKIANHILKFLNSFLDFCNNMLDVACFLDSAFLQLIVSTILNIGLILHYSENLNLKELILRVTPWINCSYLDAPDLRTICVPTGNINSEILFIVPCQITNCLIFLFDQKMIRVPFDLNIENDSLKSVFDFLKYFQLLIQEGESTIRRKLDPSEWWECRKKIDLDIQNALALLNYRVEIGLSILNLVHGRIIPKSTYCEELLSLYLDYFHVDLVYSENKLNCALKTLFIVLDQRLFGVPFESLESMEQMSIYRVPHSYFSSRIYTTSLGSGSFILNPSADLAKTEQRLEMKFKHIGWKRFRKKVDQDAWFSLLDENIFVYSGHGAGEKYYNPTDLVKFQSNSVVMLLGCSSLKLIDYGIGSRSIYENYLQIGCKAVVGTLWDVTDKDLDVQTISLIDGLQFGKDLGMAVQESRAELKLKYLNGSALIVCGSPVYFE